MFSSGCFVQYLNVHVEVWCHSFNYFVKDDKRWWLIPDLTKVSYHFIHIPGIEKQEIFPMPVHKSFSLICIQCVVIVHFETMEGLISIYKQLIHAAEVVNWPTIICIQQKQH